MWNADAAFEDGARGCACCRADGKELLLGWKVMGVSVASGSKFLIF